jgi:acetolactate synthase-1/2/3 large subunit
MKLSDYVANFLVRQGVTDVFMVAGGAAMHLNNSLGTHPGLKVHCLLHEQAAAMAAEGYAKVAGRPAVLMVTGGPGVTNALTGVYGAWLDSVPMIVLSGQVKRSDLKRGSGLRQRGNQEIDAVRVVQHVTEGAFQIDEPRTARRILEMAWHLAVAHRPGPVWLDIPLDIQGCDIDPMEQEAYRIDKPRWEVEQPAHFLLSKMSHSDTKRPVILAGNGIHVAGAAKEFRVLAEKLGIPILTTWLGMDLIEHDHQLFAGRPGLVAPRGANFAVQNADFMLVLGARLDQATVAYNYEHFAPKAYKAIVDIDSAEIGKLKTDYQVRADVKAFIQAMLSMLVKGPDRPEWVKQCQEWKNKYPVVLPEHTQKPAISTYYFTDILCQVLPKDAIVVQCSSGCAAEIVLLSFKTKKKQRVFHNRGTGAMGFALPEAIGAAIASEKQVVCIDGDGGFHMNLQELAVVHGLDLPIKIFVLNNNGYASIRNSQQRHFGKLVGADEKSGLHIGFANCWAHSMSIRTEVFDGSSGFLNLKREIATVLGRPGPELVEVMVRADEIAEPRVVSSKTPEGSMRSDPMEDLYPHLSREEFAANMLA